MSKFKILSFYAFTNVYDIREKLKFINNLFKIGDWVEAPQFGADGDVIDIDAKKGTINVRLTRAQLASRKRKWKARKSDFGSGTLWKYAQTVGPAYLGAPTHPGKKKEVKEYSKI